MQFPSKEEMFTIGSAVVILVSLVITNCNQVSPARVVPDTPVAVEEVE